MIAVVRQILEGLGYHICKEYTPWEVSDEEVIVPNNEYTTTFFHKEIRRYQERKCVECGFTQRKTIAWRRITK